MVKLLEHLAIRLPCKACGESYEVPLNDVLLSHCVVHDGCPVAQETECPPVYQTRLFDERALEEFRGAWRRLIASSATEGEIVLMESGGKMSVRNSEEHVMKDSVQNGPIRHSGTMAAPTLDFNLNEIVKQLRSEPQQSGRTAETIVKYPDLRVVLMVLKSGAKVQEHKTAGRVSVQALSGRVKVTTDDAMVDLGAGHLVTFDRNVGHALEALEDSSLLVTVAWADHGEK